ncbi:MAG: HEAT repeat domain-containing protein [Planctomycetes bacterium]|nr:HEAT repeat domain-containing protein [Planctomycetota bacterium]
MYHVKISEPVFQWVPFSEMEQGGFTKWGKEFENCWGEAELRDSCLAVSGRKKKPAMAVVLWGALASGPLKPTTLSIHYSNIEDVRSCGNRVTVRYRKKADGRLRRVYLKPYAKKRFLFGSGRRAKEFAGELGQRLAGSVKPADWSPRHRRSRKPLLFGMVALAAAAVFLLPSLESLRTSFEKPDSVEPATAEELVAELSTTKRWAPKWDDLVEKLAELDETSAVAALEESLKRPWAGMPEEAETRADLLGMLEDLAPEEVPKVLLAGLRSSDGPLSQWACEELGACGDNESVEALRAVFADESSPLRETAARALIKRRVWSARKAIHDYLSATGKQDEFESLLSRSHMSYRVANPAVVEALTSGDEDQRREAVKTLSRYHDEASAEALIQALTDEQRSIRQEAAESLGWRRESLARDALQECVMNGGEERGVRSAALEALARLPETASTDLAEILAEADLGRRREAAEALAEFTDESSERALIEALEDPTSSVGVAAAEAIGEREAALAREALLQRAMDTNEESVVRVACLKAFARLPDTVATARIPLKRLAMNPWEDPRLRKVCLDLLSGLEETVAKDMLEILDCRDLELDSAALRAFRTAAKRTWGDADRPSVAELAKKIGESEVHPTENYRLDEMLGTLEDVASNQGMAVLEAAAVSQDAERRVWALEHLVKGGDPARREALNAARDDAQKQRQLAEDREEATLEALSASEAPSLEVLLQALDDPSPKVRLRAIALLEKEPSSAARNALLALLEGDNKALEAATVTALAHRETTGVQDMVALLKHHNVGLREYAATELSELGDPSAVPALMAAISGDGWNNRYDSPGRRESVLEAIRSLAPDKVDSALVSVLKTGNASTRTWVCRELETQHAEVSAKALIALLETEETRKVALAAMIALRERQESSARPALWQILEWHTPVGYAVGYAVGHEDPRHMAALEALNAMPETARDDMIQALQHGASWVRRFAVEALMRHDPPAIAEIRPLLDDWNRSVRIVAEEAVKRMEKK